MAPLRFPGFAVLLVHRFPLWILGLALALAALGLWASWPVTLLEIRTGQEGRLVKAIPVRGGERVTYTYLHSVQKAPVVEILEIAPEGRLVVRETEYQMFGAGLPSDVLDGTFVLDAEKGRFRIIDMSRELPDFRVRVAYTAEQTLEVRGEKFRLDALAAPTTLLVVEVSNRPRIATLHW